MTYDLTDFVRESNRIEGILREPTPEEVEAHTRVLALDIIKVTDLEQFVHSVAGAELRARPGMNVRIGNHLPPPGGPEIIVRLERILDSVNSRQKAHSAHKGYERLHPFMDGNGRSGRVLWLWMMGGIEKAPLGFLHTWYYQSL